MQQMLPDIIYVTLFIAAIVSACFVVFSRKAMYSALGLVATMLCLAGIFLMIQAPFVALIQVLVYAGAVMVLFLYVIMLINPRVLESFSAVVSARRGLAVFTGMAFLLFTIAWGLTVRAGLRADFAPKAVGVTDLANLMLTKYLLLFELTSLLLLVAIIGAVAISRRSGTE